MNLFKSALAASPASGVAWALVLALSACGQQSQAPQTMAASAVKAAAAPMDLGLGRARVAQASADEQGAQPGGASDALQRHIAVRHEIEMALPAERIDEAWKAVAQRCAQLDCEVLSSSLQPELPDQPGGAQLNMRVAPKDVEALLSHVQGQGSVAAHHTASEDKTAQVIDVQAHIQNRTEFRDSLRALLKEGGAQRKLAEVLEIQRTLSQTQAELDSHATQLKLLMQETTRQAVSVSLRPQMSLVNGGAANPIAAALRQVGQVMAGSVAGIITAAAALLPWLVLALLVLGLLLWGRRRWLARGSA